MNDRLALAIEAAGEMAESLIEAGQRGAEPMNPSLREQVWNDLQAELKDAGLSFDEALRLYAEERRQSSVRQSEEEKN